MRHVPGIGFDLKAQSHYAVCLCGWELRNQPTSDAAYAAYVQHEAGICKLCKGEGRMMQNPTGDHDGANWLSCPVCQTDRLKKETRGISGAHLSEERLRVLKAQYA